MIDTLGSISLNEYTIVYNSLSFGALTFVTVAIFSDSIVRKLPQSSKLR